MIKDKNGNAWKPNPFPLKPLKLPVLAGDSIRLHCEVLRQVQVGDKSMRELRFYFHYLSKRLLEYHVQKLLKLGTIKKVGESTGLPDAPKYAFVTWGGYAVYQNSERGQYTPYLWSMTVGKVNQEIGKASLNLESEKLALKKDNHVGLE